MLSPEMTSSRDSGWSKQLVRGSIRASKPKEKNVDKRKGISMRTRTIAIAAVAGMLVIGGSLPASADTSGATTASVTVTGGFLSITVPTAAGSLGDLGNTYDGGNIDGPLGEVQVEDARSAAAGSGWVTSAISSAFTGPGGSLAAGFVDYNAGTITKEGTATYTANNPASLVGVVPVVTATEITGDNRATWDPMIDVDVAGGTVAGTYSATITHSVL